MFMANFEIINIVDNATKRTKLILCFRYVFRKPNFIFNNVSYYLKTLI